MTKQLIVVDVDEVISDSLESLRVAVNAQTGAALTLEHYKVPGEYSEYFDRVWAAHGLADQVVYDSLEPRMDVDQSHILPHPGAVEVLQALSQRYELAILTARNPDKKVATLRWLDSHFPDVFSQVVFGGGHADPSGRTKGAICAELGASWLIDDNVTHCRSARDNGVEPVLFGEYGWHLDVPDDMKRCRDWQAVAELFDVA